MGILNAKEGYPERATFIVDPDGFVQHVSVNTIAVARNPEEILRILDALMTGELTAYSWRILDSLRKGDASDGMAGCGFQVVDCP